MYGRKHIHRVAALLTAVAALAFFAGSVQAADSRPAGMTKAAYRALMLRSEALNRPYGLGSGALLATSAFWFATVKWAGGLYLLFLGAKLLRAGVSSAGLEVLSMDSLRRFQFCSFRFMQARRLRSQA